VTRSCRTVYLRSWAAPSAGKPRTSRPCSVLGVGLDGRTRCRAVLSDCLCTHPSGADPPYLLPTCQGRLDGLTVHGVPRFPVAAGVTPPFPWSPRFMRHTAWFLLPANRPHERFRAIPWRVPDGCSSRCPNPPAVGGKLRRRLDGLLPPTPGDFRSQLPARYSCTGVLPGLFRLTP